MLHRVSRMLRKSVGTVFVRGGGFARTVWRNVGRFGD